MPEMSAMLSLVLSGLMCGVIPTQDGDNPFVGLMIGDESSPFRVKRSFVDGIREGSKLTGAKRTSEGGFVPIAKWGSPEEYAVIIGDDEIVFKGLDPDGDSFEATVRVNLPYLLGRRYPAIQPYARSRVAKLCGLPVDQALARGWSGFLDFCGDTAVGSQAFKGNRLDDFNRLQLDRWATMKSRIPPADAKRLDGYRLSVTKALAAAEKLDVMTDSAGSGMAIRATSAKCELEDVIRQAAEYILEGRPKTGVVWYGADSDVVEARRKLIGQIRSFGAFSLKAAQKPRRAQIKRAIDALVLDVNSINVSNIADANLKRHLLHGTVRALRTQSYGN